MGDAILCTPALRAIRQHFKSAQITFFANSVVRDILSPCNFNDVWLEQKNSNPFDIAKMLKDREFTHAILFKNSFASALTVFLAGINSRIGYGRQGRGVLLTDKLHPPKLPFGKFKPFSMVDYYLTISSWLGCDTRNRKLELLNDAQSQRDMHAKLPQIALSEGPIVVMVVGGAFGPSKCWPVDRFAQTADRLIENYNATVVVSVSQNSFEKQLAKEICDLSKHKLINLAQTPLSLSELKSLFSVAELVISNDTGPRHIAIAMGRKVVSLFGPNDPVWTDTGYENEIQIVGDVPCAPCAKPKCKKDEHLCMQAISIEAVCDAAKQLLEGNGKTLSSMPKQKFIEISKSFFVDAEFEHMFGELGLTSFDSVFSFNAGKNLTKANLASYRGRVQFEAGSPPKTMFLKRYDSPPILIQLKNLLAHRKWISCGFSDMEPAIKLSAASINVPKIVAYGEEKEGVFEKRSFCVSEKIPYAESIERKLPDYFLGATTDDNMKLRRAFITRLASFIRRFHQTGFRHRDLYFAHVFYSDSGQFYLIDLARAFKPNLFAERFRVKDIAQLYYSAPGRYFSKMDRLRFYRGYIGSDKLTWKDKRFVSKVKNKAKRIARHDIKHGRAVPFLD